MQLIADSGSTKTNWCLITTDTKQYRLESEGYNPYFLDTTQILASLKEKS